MNAKYFKIRIAIILISLLFLFNMWWTNTRAIVAYDCFGYYLYLPAATHLNDLRLQDFNKVQSLHQKVTKMANMYQVYRVKDSKNNVIRYPIGMAVCFLPSYVVSYIISAVCGVDHQDGFNPIYLYSLFIWAFIVSLLGIYFLYRFLVHYFSFYVSSIALVFIILGTNYFFHSHMAGQGIMPHNFLFSLYAYLLYIITKWDTTGKLRYLSYAFIACALISIVRVSEIFCFIIPVLYKVSSLDEFRRRLALIFMSNWRTVLLLIMPALFILLIQLGYWKYVTGSWLYDSYQDNPGESLDILKPYLLESFFSFRKGIFIYTPIILFLFLGLRHLYFQARQWFWSVSIFFIINVYIIISWSCWWYADSFGNRAIIPTYAILSIGVGFLIQKVNELSWWKVSLFYTFSLAFVLLNIFQTWQFIKGILPSDRISKDYYINCFGLVKSPTNEQRSLLLHHYDPARKDTLPELYHGKLTKLFSVENDMINAESRDHIVQDSTGQQLLEKLEKGHHFSIGSRISNRMINTYDYVWLHLSTYIQSPTDEEDIDVSLASMMERRKNKIHHWEDVKAITKQWKANEWKKIDYWYMIDKISRDKEQFVSFIWNRSDKTVYCKNINIDVYAPLIPEKNFPWQ